MKRTVKAIQLKGGNEFATMRVLKKRFMVRFICCFSLCFLLLSATVEATVPYVPSSEIDYDQSELIIHYTKAPGAAPTFVCFYKEDEPEWRDGFYTENETFRNRATRQEESVWNEDGSLKISYRRKLSYVGITSEDGVATIVNERIEGLSDALKDDCMAQSGLYKFRVRLVDHAGNYATYPRIKDDWYEFDLKAADPVRAQVALTSSTTTLRSDTTSRGALSSFFADLADALRDFLR